MKCIIYSPISLQDVAVFGPAKTHWRKRLEKYRENEGMHYASLPKQHFSGLLRETLEDMEPTLKSNIISGFRTCGIIPLNRDALMAKLSGLKSQAVCNELAGSAIGTDPAK